MVCIVDHQIVLATLCFEFLKVKSDFLVHRNLNLPRTVFIVIVICWII